MISLAIFARNANFKPSDLLGITDDLTAFEFNSVCGYLYNKYENEREAKRLEVLIKSVGMMLGAKPEDFNSDDDEDDADIM